MANEHQEWINNPNSGLGGMDKYVANQQTRYEEALASNDMDLLGRLAADAQKVGYTLSSSPTSQVNKGFDRDAELAGMERYLQGASDSYLKQQQAMLEQNLTAQISELQSLYQQAVADGEISVRDAETQFNERVKQIQQQAYLDAERTALYGQDMGLQNSQQMIGLMQGDAARQQSLMQEGMSDRDKRINDIKDRMNAVKSQKDISIARAQVDYRSGLLGAQSEAQRMYNEGMFGLMRDDYGARREQSFAQENLRLQDELTRGQMNEQHKYNLAAATHDSLLAIERMNLQHGFDLEKMAKALEDDIKKMGIQYGYQSSLQSQSAAATLTRMKEEYKLKSQAEIASYQKQLERELAGITPGTDEYKVITANNERQLKSKLAELHAGTVYEAVTTRINKEYPGSDIGEPPKDKRYITYDLGGNTITDYNLLGGFQNWLTGYAGKKEEYDKNFEAQKRYLDMINSISNYLPWNY